MQGKYPVGTEVILWSRPTENVLLLLGEGRYEGDNYINSDYFPVVKLADGRELTVHQQGVAIGRKESVATQVRNWTGALLQFDIARYIRGERPSMEEVRAATPSSPGAPRNANPASEPEPKTATDRLMLLKRKIDYERSKQEAAKAIIAESDKAILVLQSEMSSIRDAVLQELAAIGTFTPVVTPEQPQSQLPPVIEEELPPEPPPSNDVFDAEARNNALTD